jgi:hypothetical protein
MDIYDGADWTEMDVEDRLAATSGWDCRPQANNYIEP